MTNELAIDANKVRISPIPADAYCSANTPKKANKLNNAGIYALIVNIFSLTLL